MPRRPCAVALCTNKDYPPVENLSFHRFPKDVKIRKAWVLRCHRKDFFNPETSRICSEHFSEEDFQIDMKAKLMEIPSKRRLKQDAIPSRNLLPEGSLISSQKASAKISSKEARREPMLKKEKQGQPKIFFSPKEMADETKSSSRMVVVKEEEPSIDYDGLTPVKQEFLPDEDGLIHIKQEVILPDEASMVVKEEETSIAYDGLTPVKQEFLPDEGGPTPVKGLYIKREVAQLVPDVADGLTPIKEELNVKHEEELLIPDIGTQISSCRTVKLHQCLHCVPQHLKRPMMAYHTGEKPHQCPCDYKSVQSGSEKSHLIAHHNSGGPDHCDNYIVCSQNLKRHKTAIHVGEKPHQCPHCDYKSVRSQDLKKHVMGRHTGERPYQCSHCDYKSVTSQDLKKHVMSHHTGERPYQCLHCDYKSVSSQDLKKHTIARHTGEKPHQCLHCDYKSVRSQDLKKHTMARHTGEKPHQCPYCDYKSVTSKELKVHTMARHTGKKPHQCPYCDYKSVTFQQMKRHTKARHAL